MCVKKMCRFMLILLSIVQLSKQCHVHPINEELVISSITRAIVNLENRLEAKFNDVYFKLSEVDNSMVDVKQFMNNIKQDTDSMKTSLKMIKNTVQHLDENVDEIETFKSDTSKLLQKIKQNTDSVKEPLDVVKNTVLSLEINAEEVNKFHNNPSKLLQKINQNTYSVKVPLDVIQNTVQVLKENADAEQIFQTNTSELLDKIKKDTEYIKIPIEMINKTVLYLKESVDKRENVESDTSNLLQEIKTDTNSLMPIDASVDSSLECPEGFFKLKGSMYCFKFFNDEKRSWEDAQTKCQDEGLVLAEPSDTVAVSLRKHLLDIYGNVGWVWVGGRGDGAKMVWQYHGTEFRREHPLCIPGLCTTSDVIGTDRCLALYVWTDGSYGWTKYPGQPYLGAPCSLSNFPLCEHIM